MAERLIPSILSTLLAGNALLFVSQQFKWFPQAKFTENNDPFYLAFLILGILSVGAVLYFMRSIRVRRILERLLLLFFPTELTLIFGLSQSKNFHYVFLIAIGFYILVAGMVAIHVYVTRETGERPLLAHALRSALPWIREQGFLTLFAVAFLTILFFSFGYHGLTHFAAVDEPLWTDGRIPKYWKNIGERDWKGTRISDKPGITVALAAGPGIWFVDTKDYKAIRSGGELHAKDLDIETLYYALRLPLLITITLFLPFFYVLIERLLGKRDALLAYAGITLSPVLLGMSTIINPDSLLWLFVPQALLAYLVFLKRRHYRYLILSGVLVGLALLTKYVANFVIVFMVGLVFLEWIYQERAHAVSLSDYLKRSLSDLSILIFTALATFYVLFPAVWVKPEKLITSTLYSQAFEKFAPLFIVLLIFIGIDLAWNRTRALSYLLGRLERARVWIGWGAAGFFLVATLTVLVNSWLGMTGYDFMSLLSSPKTVSGRTDIFGIFLTNFYPLLFGLPPFILLGIFAGVSLIFRKAFFADDQARLALYLILFILLYYVGATGNGVAMIVRYQIILFPIATLLATLGLLVLLDRFVTLKAGYAFTLLFSLLGVTGLSTLVTTPFPLSYASSLLPDRFHTDVKDMGPGSYEAAQWLNRQPDAENLTIWTDKDGVCKFFVGKCRRGFGNYDTRRREGIDYIVVSSGRESRTTKIVVGQANSGVSNVIRYDQYYHKPSPIHEILINGRPNQFVKIYPYAE
ncbi:MAG: glycosyltransferase family 39 protein [Candidatus Moraniibacteriota bacterium]|nr:MAG: glycosyltransferase family 39 protein [Candidatus Moranbacteria bacterium]